MYPLSPEPFYNRPEQYDHDHYKDDSTEFPTLPEWLAGVENHPTRNMHGDNYSQYSHAFDLNGLGMLLDLEGLRPEPTVLTHFV